MSLTVAVIIPTYNRPSDLLRAVSSVYRQTRKVQEVWVVNDGEIHAGFVDLLMKYPEIHIIHNEKSQGANYSRNLGAKMASADILMFLDDDDWWAEEKVAYQLRLLEKNKEFGLVYSGKLVIYDHEPDRVQYKIQTKNVAKPIKAILEDNFIGTTSSVAIRKEIFEKAGLFNESLPAMQDYELWIRICMLTQVRTDESYHVYYTVNKKSKKPQISKLGVNQIKASEIIFEKYKQDFINNGINLSKRKAKFYFRIAKAIRITSFFQSLPWIFKSFLLRPDPKTLFLLFSTEKPF